MSDRYAQLVNSLPGRLIAGRVGLPRPARLERYAPGAPAIPGPVLLGAAAGGRLVSEVERLLKETGTALAPAIPPGEGAAAQSGAAPVAVGAQDGASNGGDKVRALVFDASGIADSTQLVELQRFFHPNVRRIAPSGRVVVLGAPPEGLAVRAATAQRALEGFTRSLGKEVGHGIAVQLLYVAEGAEDRMDSTLCFLLSPRSAYVSGQTIRIGASVLAGSGAAQGRSAGAAGSGAELHPGIDWERPLAGRRALVTGASRGIGAAIAQTLHRDGAQLVLLDVPALADDLKRVAQELSAETIELDITEADAPKKIADALGEGVDVVVHNAGVTRDRTLAKMPEDRWTGLMEINLSAEERIDDELLARDLLRENGRIVCVSSMSGIAGNAGQTNYATSKAGVIGMVQALAPALARRGCTINAVAPGFIETQMTAKMPLPLREAGRRMNSMSQGGLPVDVAETIAWFASPASDGVNGNVVRVCGQSLLGA